MECSRHKFFVLPDVLDGLGGGPLHPELDVTVPAADFLLSMALGCFWSLEMRLESPLMSSPVSFVVSETSDPDLDPQVNATDQTGESRDSEPKPFRE